MDLGITIGMWSVYYALHSWLAADRVKSNIAAKTERLSKYYRLFYSTISILGLGIIFWFLATTPSPFILDKSAVLKFVAMILTTWGVIIVRLTFKHYSIREFLGLTKEPGNSTLHQSGVLQYVRHPLYTGTILISIGFWLYIPNLLNLVSCLCTYIYLAIGIRLEEKKLIRQFGEVYMEYRDSTPMLIPNLGRMLFKSR